VKTDKVINLIMKQKAAEWNKINEGDQRQFYAAAAPAPNLIYCMSKIVQRGKLAQMLICSHQLF
jgi:hypothetical protein